MDDDEFIHSRRNIDLCWEGVDGMSKSHTERVTEMVAVAVFFACVALSRAAGAEQPLQVAVDADSLTIRAGEAPFLQYRYGDVAFKPYVKELFTPSGLNVLLDSPPDHVHHHALMFACEVNGVDFWGEVAGQVPLGKQVPERFDDVAVIGPEGHRWARFGEDVRWVSQRGNEPLLLEHRTITAGRVGDPAATFLTWECTLAVPRGKESVVLSGAHYHGLGMRFIRSMDADGEFRNPDNDPGVIFRGEERLSRSRWCAYTAKADGKLVTAAMFDHPNNPRHPATWFTMAKPFAYLSATMRLHEQSLKVLSGKPLVLRYGVALWEGRVETAQIDELYKQWLAMQPNDAAKR
jgi:hypothetical protein